MKLSIYRNYLPGGHNPAHLTTEHASCSYGQPVLIVGDTAYGAADLVPCESCGDTWTQSAASIVYGTDDSLAVAFCRLVDDAVLGRELKRLSDLN